MPRCNKGNDLPSFHLKGKARLKTAICAYSYREMLAKKTLTYEDLVRMAADMNIDGLDLTSYPPTMPLLQVWACMSLGL